MVSSMSLNLFFSCFFFPTFSVTLVCFQTWLIIFNGLLLLAHILKTISLSTWNILILCSVSDNFNVWFFMGLTPVHEVFCWLSLMVPCSLFVRFLTVNLHCLELYLWEVCGGERVGITMSPFMTTSTEMPPLLWLELSNEVWWHCFFFIPLAVAKVSHLLVACRYPNIPCSFT